jgi:hypothetical protein
MAKSKQLQPNDPLSSFLKPNKTTKLKLRFSSAFAQLNALERERRLHGGHPLSETNTTDDATPTATTAATPTPTAPTPPTPPDNYLIAVHVTHNKTKHVLYFSDPETCNVGGLRARISTVIGVAPERQRLILKGGKIIGMGMNAKQVNSAETLLALSKNKNKLKVKLLFDAKHHHAVASTVTLQDVKQRLVQLEKIVSGLHRQMSHRMFDQVQMIINGRNFVDEIKDLEKSVERLPKAESALLVDVGQRVQALKRLNEEIAEMMLGVE